MQAAHTMTMGVESPSVQMAMSFSLELSAQLLPLAAPP